jgi:hypothetical protein
MPLRDYQPTNSVFLKLADDEGSAKPGGRVIEMKAVVALNCGDAVLVSVADQVTKDSVATNHKNRVGVVVGGKKTDMRVLSGTESVGVPAAAINEQVLVQTDGIAWVTSDAAILIMAKLRLGTTTAGRVLSGLDTTDLVAGITGLILGSALDAAGGAAVKIRMLIALG